MEDLINEFIAETREMLEALGGEIVAWEAAPNERDRLDEIFRFVHTVKGNCGFFDLPRLETLSHAAEDALADVRAGRRVADHRLVSAVLAIIDRIGELVHALETGEEVASADDQHLIHALSETRETIEQAELATATAAPEQRKALRSIRLSVDLLDSMMSGVSDLVLARNELSRRLRESGVDNQVEAAFERVSSSIGEIRDAITRTRMQRIESLFVALPRMVRDLASELGKQVTLELDGHDVELDREMIELMRDPLTHIVRNAMDHGIELPRERQELGKSSTGTLRVAASQSGNQILIEISDDGRGIDSDKLVRKAIAAGIVTETQAERLSIAQKCSLIFEAGLSTASEVTAVSGRGVGMDVVRANVERIGGTIDIGSIKGQGLRLTLRVPLTLSIIPALTITENGQVYAVPRSAVIEIVRARSETVQIDDIGGSQMMNLRGSRIPLVSLSRVFGAADRLVTEDQTILVLKPAGGDCYALSVDAVLDHAELVIKPAAPVVMAAGLYAGTTLTDDGSPILLLDASGIAIAAGISLGQKQVEKTDGTESGEALSGPETQVLVFRTLDGIKRAINLGVVLRIEEVQADAARLTAGKLRIALDNKILALAGFGERRCEGRLRILRLSDGVSELAYAFEEVIDLVTLRNPIKAASVAGEIGGVTLIGGDQVELIDPFWLFSVHGGDAASAPSRPVCAIPADDQWMQNILRPVIESAGYRVVAAGEVAAPDILIASAEEPVDEHAAAAEIIRIRALPDASPGNDDSIYRYDRAALLAALGRRAGRKG